MLFLEKSRGIKVSSDSCYIRVNIHSEEGNVFQFDRFTGNTIDIAISNKDNAIFVCYKKYLIWIAVGNNRITINELLKKTDTKIKFLVRDFQKGGFARSVGSYECYLVPFVYIKGYIFE